MAELHDIIYKYKYMDTTHMQPNNQLHVYILYYYLVHMGHVCGIFLHFILLNVTVRLLSQSLCTSM